MKNNGKFVCQKAKELILKNVITLDSFEKEELELLIDYETETVVNSKTEPDLTFLNDCYEALKKYENSDNIISEKNLKEIEQKARIRYQSKFTHYIPRKRLATIIIAAALLICLLCMTAYAYLNPFSQFVKNVKDLLGIESGAVINNGDGELSADKNAVVYESIEDLEKAFGLKTLSLNGNNKYTILSIKSYTKNNQNYIEIIYDNDGQSIFETVYPDNAPYDEGCMIKAVTDVLHFNGFDIYMINTDNNVQAVIFDGPVAYCIVGSDRTEIINFITGE